MTAHRERIRFLAFGLCLGLGTSAAAAAPADLLLVNGRVYTFTWDEPGRDGTPAANAPRSAAGFHPDATTVAVQGERGAQRRVQSARR